MVVEFHVVMRRRAFLASGAIGVVAGCVSGDGEGDNDGAADPADMSDVTGDGEDVADDGMEDTDDDKEPSDDDTEPSDDDGTADDEEPDPASFSIEEISLPETIELGDSYQFEVVVANDGDESGTFETTWEISVAETTEWFEADDPIYIDDLDGGETATWTSDEFTAEEIFIAQVRLPEYDLQVEMEVTAPDVNYTIEDSTIADPDSRFRDAYAEVRLRNDSEFHMTHLRVACDWYEDGDYLSSTDLRWEVLPSGKTMAARTPELFDDGQDPDALEATLADYRPLLSLEPDAIELEDTEALIGDEVRARAETTNTTDEDQDLIRVVAHALTANGTIIGEEWTYEEWQANESRTLDLAIETYERVDQVDDIAVYLLE